jgi:predicted acyltransferase
VPSAITAALWLGLYFIADVWQIKAISRPLAIAGENVLLAYILSEMMESVLDVIGVGDWYGDLAGPYLTNAIARSVGCGIFILGLTALLNRLGFRLKL